MSPPGDLKLVRILKIGLDILYGTFVVASVLLVLWIVSSPIIIRQAGIPGTVSVPVILGSGEGSRMEVTFAQPTGNKISAAFVEHAQGTLLLETRNFQMIIIANAAKLVLAIGLANIFFLLRGVVQATLERNPFGAENVRRIRLLGYRVLFIGILVQAVDYIAAREILNQLPLTEPALEAGSTFDPGLILATLLIMLLAHIWSYGLELERDRALTI